MFQTHLCRVCDHPSPASTFSVSLIPLLPSLLHAISLPVPPASSPSPLSVLSLSLSLFQTILARFLFLSPVSSLSHTRSPPTGEHSPCQTRIDLTLSVADYKSDQLGARCACRIGIGERSEGANAAGTLSLRESLHPGPTTSSHALSRRVRHSFPPLGD